jgi:hypothetical protein
VRSVEPACPGRHRSAPGLGTWRRSARSASPDHAARCCHRGCRSPGRRRGDVGRAGQFDHGITAALRSRALRPRRDSSAPGSLRSVRLGRDPSIGGVQPSCQRSAPGIRIDAPSSSPGGCRGSRRFTRFDPRCARRSGVLCRRGVCPTSLWRSWSFHGAGFAATTTAESPRRIFDPPRERRVRACGRGVPSTDEERSKALLLVRCRASRRAFRRLAEAARLGASERARPRPRPFFGTGHCAPTSAIDAKPEHTRVVTVTPPAPWLPKERWLRNRSLRAASMAMPHPPAVPSPEARAWLHGGPERSGYGHPRREHGWQRVLEHRYSPNPPRPPLLVRANVRAAGEAGVPSSREETAPSLVPAAAP